MRPVRGWFLHSSSGCFCIHQGRPKAWMSTSRWFRSSWVDLFFGGLRVMLIDYYMCKICYITMLLYFYMFLYTVFTSDNIHIWFISPSLIWIFFHQVVSFAQVQWRYYDLPGRSSLFLRLSRWSNKPWHTVGRKKPLEERPFFGDVVWIHPVFLPIDTWYMMLKW